MGRLHPRQRGHGADIGVVPGDFLEAARKLAVSIRPPGFVLIRGGARLVSHVKHVATADDQDDQEIGRPLGLQPGQEILIDATLSEVAVMNFLESIAIHANFLPIWERRIVVGAPSAGNVERLHPNIGIAGRIYSSASEWFKRSRQASR